MKFRNTFLLFISSLLLVTSGAAQSLVLTEKSNQEIKYVIKNGEYIMFRPLHAETQSGNLNFYQDSIFVISSNINLFKVDKTTFREIQKNGMSINDSTYAPSDLIFFGDSLIIPRLNSPYRVLSDSIILPVDGVFHINEIAAITIKEVTQEQNRKGTNSIIIGIASIPIFFFVGIVVSYVNIPFGVIIGVAPPILLIAHGIRLKNGKTFKKSKWNFEVVP